MNAERDPSDPALDRLLRADAGASPSAELDAAILAAAHRAVASAPRETRTAEATRPWRWWMPLVAAAAIGAVAIGVLQLVPSGHESAPAVVSDMPATRSPQVIEPPAPALTPVPAPAPVPPIQSQPSAPKVTAETPAPRESAPVRRKASEPAAAPEPFPADRAPPAQAPSPAPAQESAQAPALPPAAPAAAAPSAPAAALNAESTRRDAAQGATGAVDRAAAPALARSATKDDSQARRADEFIARIRRLWSEGKMEEAAQELTAFRAAFADADARLPPDLRPWAANVKQ